jgi:CBS domain-containing protein
MSTRLITATPDTDIKEVAALMRDKEVGCVPIVSDNQLVGVVSDSDFLSLVDKLV